MGIKIKPNSVFKSRTRDSRTCRVGRSVKNIVKLRAVFALRLLPNRPRLYCRVSGTGADCGAARSTAARKSWWPFGRFQRPGRKKNIKKGRRKCQRLNFFDPKN